MNIKECYQAFGGNYEDVRARMPDDAFIGEFLADFLEDENYGELQKAMNTQDIESAFRAAHSLKGICQNFGYQQLYQSSSCLTEILRKRSFDGSEQVMKQVSADYELMCRTIQQWMSANE